MIITLTLLETLDACESQIEKFKKLFGYSMVVNDHNLRKAMSGCLYVTEFINRVSAHAPDEPAGEMQALRSRLCNILTAYPSTNWEVTKQSRLDSTVSFILAEIDKGNFTLKYVYKYYPWMHFKIRCRLVVERVTKLCNKLEVQ